MHVYTCIMFALALGLLVVGGLFCAGVHGWFYLFDRSSHKDDKEYSRFLGKPVISLAAVMLVSGFAYMLAGTALAVALLIVGVVGAFAIMIKNSRKYY